MTALTGFPEWLPEQEMVQQHIIRVIREQFELHGFVGLQTRAVEELDDLMAQGDTSKEIYGVHRIGGEEAEARLGLHYDLTVPFARYVSENKGRLVFPFRRYQIQPAWRGERPQLGRYREFIQADVDIIVQGELHVRHDAEMVLLLHQVVERLPVPRIRLLVNNRKLLEGLYRGLGITDVTNTLRIVDKLTKIGPDGVVASLVEIGLTDAQARACVDAARIEIEGPEGFAAVRALGVEHPLLEEGIRELGFVLDHCRAGGARPGAIIGALHIARGFDYYTGTVVEGLFEEHPELRAVCSGGRYDNLASDGAEPRLPGVGVSIGVTRLLSYCFHLGLLKQDRKTPAQVLVAIHSEETRQASEQIAATLRGRGVPCLVSDSAAPYGKQIRAAERLGVPYVWFPAHQDHPHEVKDIQARVQATADLATWTPSPDVVRLKL